MLSTCGAVLELGECWFLGSKLTKRYFLVPFLFLLKVKLYYSFDPTISHHFPPWFGFISRLGGGLSHFSLWVQAHNLPPNALATAVNGDFVPRTLRAQTVLKAGDAIVTFQAIEGG